MSYRIKHDSKKDLWEIFPASAQPLIYHDTNITWHISVMDKEERSIFLDSFYASGGTLCLSLNSIAEMLRREKGEWFDDFCDYLDTIGDRFVFLNADISEVMRKENDYPSDAIDPAIDTQLLKNAFIHFYLRHNQEPNLRQVFEYLYEDEGQKREILEHYDDLIHIYKTKMHELRDEYREPGGKEKFKQALKDAKARPRYTTFMFRTAMFEIAKNPSMGVSDRDAHDLLHTVVPVSWCDCVVLDKCWQEIAKKALKKRWHHVNVFKFSEREKYYKILKELGIRINTEKWKHRLRNQGPSPFDRGPTVRS